MNAVFADTFYWIAFTNPQDTAHEKAKEFTLSAKPGPIYTTEEVLTEYLNYFAGWGSSFRRYAANSVQKMRENQTVRIVPQTAASFEAGFTPLPCSPG
jgi:predicted nucleic acid-binding protein